jgi:hypothetical protein
MELLARLRVARVTTALVVSRTFPLDNRRAGGMVQRLELELEALARAVDRLQRLFERALRGRGSATARS